MAFDEADARRAIVLANPDEIGEGSVRLTPHGPAYAERRSPCVQRKAPCKGSSWRSCWASCSAWSSSKSCCTMRWTRTRPSSCTREPRCCPAAVAWLLSWCACQL